MIKALSLFSGGLDSMLAAKVILEQGIEVVAINFSTPFFGSTNAEKGAKQLGIELKIVDLFRDHFTVLRNPKHGYGKHLNPCIDCHALMIRKTGELMEELSAQFIITGEVLGQRPMSQNYRALKIVEEESGYAGFVVRPLSGKLLPPTIPEEKGWLDREGLLDISGRSRKAQMALAKKYGLKEYPSPAGGCLLTEEVFSLRLKDLLDREENLEVNDLDLLKLGRHLRLGERTKLILGRNRDDNARLEELVNKDDILLRAATFKGPTGLLRGPQGEKQSLLPLAAAITARYGRGKDEEQVEINYYHPGEAGAIISVEPASEEEIKRLLLR